MISECMCLVYFADCWLNNRISVLHMNTEDVAPAKCGGVKDFECDCTVQVTCGYMLILDG